jgi:hypothetical protein
MGLFDGGRCGNCQLWLCARPCPCCACQMYILYLCLYLRMRGARWLCVRHKRSFHSPSCTARWWALRALFCHACGLAREVARANCRVIDVGRSHAGGGGRGLPRAARREHAQGGREVCDARGAHDSHPGDGARPYGRAIVWVACVCVFRRVRRAPRFCPSPVLCRARC